MEKQEKGVLLDDTYVKIAQQKYEEAKAKSVNKSRMRVAGEAYVGKNKNLRDFCIKAATKVALIVTAVVVMKTANDGMILNDYQEQVNQIIQEETKEDTLLAVNYQNIQNLKNSSVMDDLREKMSILDDIKEEKKELKETDDYGLFSDKNLYEDAVRNVAEERTYPDIEQAKNL